MTKRPKAQIAAPHEPCRHDARFVAWMLRTSPYEVFPCGPDIGEEGDDHLVLAVTAKVDELAARLNDDDDGSEAFAAYRRRVAMLADVMAGKLSAPPQSMWDRMAERYGRGIYLSAAAHLRRESRT